MKPESGQFIKVDFYNNDTAKQYRVVIIGPDSVIGLSVFYDEKLP